jgi:hypothetical protein
MKLKMFKALWVMEHLPQAADLSGNLEYNAMVFTNEGDHKESFRIQVERAANRRDQGRSF